MERLRTNYLLIAPSAAIFVALFIAPFGYFFFLSFWQVKLFKLSADLTTKNYVEAYDRAGGILALTIELAAIVALLTTVLGFIYAYIIRFKAGRWGPALLLISLVTLFGGYLMKIYAWKTILGNEGVINSALMTLGITTEPVTAIFYSPGAVVVTLVHVLLPFAILPIYASLRGIDDIELEAARDLGAKPWNTLGGIVIPQCKAGIIAAFTFCFLLPAGDYITPLLVGGKIQLIGNMVRDQFGKSFNWPLGSAMAVAILASALVVVVLANALMSFWRPR